MSSETSKLMPCRPPCRCSKCTDNDVRYVRLFRQWLEEEPEENLIRACVQSINREISLHKKVAELEKDVNRLLKAVGNLAHDRTA